MIYSEKLNHIQIQWIREQGYFNYSNEQIRDLAFGNRFAYRICSVLIIPAVVFAHVPTLLCVNVIALAGVFMPRHPFDYIYNALIRKWTKGPKLPPRSPQLKFACTMASFCLGITTYFFISEMPVVAYLIGIQMIGVVLLVSLFDLCLPSKIFNFFNRRHPQSQM